MTFLELASEIIIGYDSLLPELVRQRFEAEIGQCFVKVVTKAAERITKLEVEKNKQWPWPFSKAKASLQEEIDRIKKEVSGNALEALTDEGHKFLIGQIIVSKLLPKIYSDIEFLSKEEQLLVAQAEFSSILHSEYIKADRAVTSFRLPSLFPHPSDDDLYGMIVATREEIVTKWLKDFSTHESMSTMRTKIAEGKASSRAGELGNFFKLLNDRRLANPTLPIDQLYNEYNDEIHRAETEHRPPNTQKVEKDFLTKLLFQQLQTKAGRFIDALQIDSSDLLRAFNADQAEAIAEKILEAFNGREALEMKKWLDDYGMELKQCIQKEIELINGKKWLSPILDGLKEVVGPLSFLWNNAITHGTGNFFNRLGDAYSFIQYMGASAENENFVFAIVDVYNLVRHSRELAEAKGIFVSLSKPFEPLRLEYKEIATYETNFFKKVFRIVMPLLIITGLLVLVALALSPFGLPELAFLAISIPTIIVGLALATKYVTWKNSFANWFHQWRHGGPFEVPEFKVNERMILTFGNEQRYKKAASIEEKKRLYEKYQQRAERVRAIYIEAIQQCDRKEAKYRDRETSLTGIKLEKRKDNLVKRVSLILEWYDIHSNAKLGTDVAKKIAVKRLTTMANDEYKSSLKHFKEDAGEINEAISALVASLKEVLLPEIDEEALNIERGRERVLNNSGRVQVDAASSAARIAVLLPLQAENPAPRVVDASREEVVHREHDSATNPLRLFSLKCMKEHGEVENIAELLESIGCPIQSVQPVRNEVAEPARWQLPITLM